MGDVLNIIALFDDEFKKKFSEIFSPVNMFISRDDGYFNDQLSLDMDQLIGIHVLCK